MEHVEKIIRELQERGEFDNLPGAGKPLDLSENPWIPPDWRSAYRLLAQNGFAPDIVEEDKAIRALIQNNEHRLEQYAARWSGFSGAQRREQQAARQRFLDQYVEEVAGINRRIHSFNAVAPAAMNRGTTLPERARREAEARLPVD